MIGSHTRVERRPCLYCGTPVEHRVSAADGEEIAVAMGEAHRAPCQLPCAAGRDVSIAEAMAGKTHHPRRCDTCMSVGRGFP